MSLHCLEAPSVTSQTLLWDFPSALASAGSPVSVTSQSHAAFLTAPSRKSSLRSCTFLTFLSAFPLLMSFSSAVVSQTMILLPSFVLFSPCFLCSVPAARLLFDLSSYLWVRDYQIYTHRFYYLFCILLNTSRVPQLKPLCRLKQDFRNLRCQW